MPISANPLQDFINIAGTDISTGFVGLSDKGELTKVGAHRHITSSNAPELSHLQNHPEINRNVRAKLYDAIQKSLGSDVALRGDILRFAATELGISKEGDEVDLNSISDTRLERRDLRNILRIVQTESLHVFFHSDMSDVEHTAQSFARREALLSALKENFQGIDWEAQPLGMLSNVSLRELGKALATGMLENSAELSKFIADSVRSDLINTEAALQQHARMKDMDPQAVKDLVELPCDREAAQAAPQAPAEAPSEAPEADAPKTGWASMLLGVLSSGSVVKNRLDTLAKNEDGALRKAVFAFRDDMLAALSAPDDKASAGAVREAMLKNLDAITLLLFQPDAVLGTIEGGGALKPFAEDLRQQVAELLKGQGKGQTAAETFRPGNEAVMHGSLKMALSSPLLADEVLLPQVQELRGKLTEHLGSLDALRDASQAGERLQRTGEQEIRNLLADLALDKDTWVHDNAWQPGERLRTTLAKHLDAVTLILCEPEKAAGCLSGPAQVIVENARSQLDALFAKLQAGDASGSGELQALASGFGADFKSLSEAASPALRPLLLSEAGEPFVRALLTHLVETVPGEALALAEQKIDEATEEACGMIQKGAAKAFEALLNGKETGSIESLFTDEPLPLPAEDKAFEDALQRIHGVPQKEIDAMRAMHAKMKGTDMKPGTLLTEYAGKYFEALPYRKPDTERLVKAFGAYVLDNMGPLEHNATVGDWMGGALGRIGSPHPEIAMRDWLNRFMASEAAKGEPLPQPMTPREQELAQLEKTKLADLVGKGSTDTQNGYGKFMLEVMKSYFTGVDRIDQRSMLASLMRFGAMEEVLPTDSPETAKQKEQNNLARQLGALFKGAGPIMQKLMQQLGSSDLPPAFKAALQDMKCNLLPIPDEIVRSRLLDAVLSSNGDIKKITVDKSLGAASVGQSLLCTITDGQDNKRQTVVKLLRPDVDARMAREKEIFLAAAGKVPGMRETYLGRLARLEEELDLRIEARNVRFGDVYDKPLVLDKQTYTDVHSMRLDAAIPPAKDLMVLERAPGDTLANYMARTSERLEQLAANPNASVEDRIRSLREMNAFRAEILQKQEGVGHLAFKWVEEGMFKKGFYHGDLHAGNIMVDTAETNNRGITVIDFGNATQLGDKDRHRIMRMVYAATSNDTDLFLDNYRKLMAEENRPKFDELREKASEEISLILQKGESEDTGLRISAALVQMQNMGLELPAQIFNFSQCQMMLQGTMSDLNALIGRVDDARHQLQKSIAEGMLLLPNQNLEIAAKDFAPERCVEACEKKDAEIRAYQETYIPRIDEGLRGIEDFIAKHRKDAPDAAIDVKTVPERLIPLFNTFSEAGKVTLEEAQTVKRGLVNLRRETEEYCEKWLEIRRQAPTPQEVSALVCGFSELKKLHEARKADFDAFAYSHTDFQKFCRDVQLMPPKTVLYEPPAFSSDVLAAIPRDKRIGKDEMLRILEDGAAKAETPELRSAFEKARGGVLRTPAEWAFLPKIDYPKYFNPTGHNTTDRDGLIADLKEYIRIRGDQVKEASEKAIAQLMLCEPGDYVWDMPVIPDEVKALIKEGETVTPESLSARLEAIKAKIEEEKRPINERYEEVAVKMAALGGSPLEFFINGYGDNQNRLGKLAKAGMLDGLQFTSSGTRQEALSDFVGTMGKVVDRHSFSAACAVGPGAGIKAIFKRS